MKFRLWMVLYAFALLAAALAMFRPLRDDWPSDRTACANNLKNIALALLNYHVTNKRFPMAVAPDATGAPAHSWRSAIGPFVEASPVFFNYVRTEPWNGPNNSQSTNTPVPCYQCPLHGDRSSPHTNYFAVVDAKTPWPPDRARKLSEIRDGLSPTIMLIDVPNRSAPWGKPEDLTLDEALDLLTSDPEEIGATHSFQYSFFRRSQRGVNVAFCDGSVVAVPLPLSEEDALSLLTADGGERVDRTKLLQAKPGELDYGRIYAAALLALMLLLPPLWMAVRSARSVRYAQLATVR